MNTHNFNKIAQQDTLINPQTNLRDTINIADTSYLLNKKVLGKADFQNYITGPQQKKTTEVNCELVNKQPDFFNFQLNDKSFLETYKENAWYYLYQNKLQSVSKIHNTNKFYTTPLIEVNKETTSINIDPTAKTSSNPDWLIAPILAGLITSVFVFKAYGKYFGLLYESIFFRFAAKKIINEKNLSFKRFSILLDTLFILSFSLIIDQLLYKLELYSPPTGTEFLLALIVSIILISIKAIRFVFFRGFVLFTKQNLFFKDLYINSLLYTRILGLILLPLVFLIIYVATHVAQLFVYFAIFTISITLIYRTIRTIKVFIDNGFSIFYFILYLCALEIAPLLVIWKEVQSRL